MPGRKNLIANGDFDIPFESMASAWGNGFYTDIFKAKTRHLEIKWINFLGAIVRMSVIKTEKGNALKIVHSDDTLGDRLGLTEQYIYVPRAGSYVLSFDVKSDNLERLVDTGLLLVTTDDWKRDPEHGGYALKQGGTFGWTHVEQRLVLDRPGTRTFTVASIAKGTVYLANLQLVKAEGDDASGHSLGL
ncbi:MAG: hypothetical protein PHF00_01465 [Elusimicrobia bacterium]|nr:hypothetical protein [Elusimicrobiota bacterium]